MCMLGMDEKLYLAFAFLEFSFHLGTDDVFKWFGCTNPAHFVDYSRT